MELISLITPGAQSLATAILSESWDQLRGAIARAWARRHADATPEHAASAGDPSSVEQPSARAVEAACRELDTAREQALALAGAGTGAPTPAGATDAAQHHARIQLFLAGYLAGRLAAHPELAEAVASLPTLLADAGLDAPPTGADASVVRNKISGTVLGPAVQARDVQGGITFR